MCRMTYPLSSGSRGRRTHEKTRCAEKHTWLARYLGRYGTICPCQRVGLAVPAVHTPTLSFECWCDRCLHALVHHNAAIRGFGFPSNLAGRENDAMVHVL